MTAALIEALLTEGGPLAQHTTEARHDGQPSGPPQRAASGPRAAANQDEYELLLEMIYEGTLLHYGTPRVVHTDDPDLALLLGDHLYALGLARLAALGDLHSVAVLADVISLLAQAHAEGNSRLAQEIWDAGAEAIGWGTKERLDDAKQRAHAR
jgi:hypothetical protein